MLVGYIRVSTLDQNTGRQEEALKNYGVTKIFLEKISGKDTNRTELKKMLEYVREGDTLVVESYSRLARSTMDLLIIIEKLKDKKVSFVSIKEQFDTSTPQGELMLTMFAGLAQFERTCMLQRQREGIEIAKRAGKFKGRKPIAVDEELFIEIYNLWKRKLITAVQAQKKLSLKSNTFYRRVIAHEAKMDK